MREITRSKIANDFRGCNGDSIYRLVNGQIWQQTQYRYEYHYAYRPEARIVEEGGRYLLYVDGLSAPVAVRRVNAVEDGVITSEFDGFSKDAVFTFQSGHSWVPAEYKYVYHYAHRPHATVIDGKNGLELTVEGMSETLRVRRA